jgi:hypothetical protein
MVQSIFNCIGNCSPPGGLGAAPPMAELWSETTQPLHIDDAWKGSYTGWRVKGADLRPPLWVSFCFLFLYLSLYLSLSSLPRHYRFLHRPEARRVETIEPDPDSRAPY